jgi:hypothetical protein
MRSWDWKLSALVGLGCIVFLWLVKAPIMSLYLSEKMGVSVSLKWIGFLPSQTRMHGFRVKNPKGYHQATALSAKQVICSYQLKELFGIPTHYREIQMDGVHINIDFLSAKHSSNNWARLGKKIRKGEGPVVIDRVVVNDLILEIEEIPGVSSAGKHHFDRLEFDKIDSRKGFPTATLVKMILDQGGAGEFVEGIVEPETEIPKLLSPIPIL